MNKNKTIATGGVGIGAVIAIILSWTVNQSILWAIIHGWLGWIYVIYHLLFTR